MNQSRHRQRLGVRRGAAAMARGLGRHAWCDTEGRGDAGASLVLALVYIVAIALVVVAFSSWALNDLNNTSHFESANALNYAASSSTEVAIQSMRYSPIASPNGPVACWSPQTTLTINTYTMSSWCVTAQNYYGANTRSVTFYTCQSAVGASQCASTPLLTAQVAFVDSPSVGASATEESWTWLGGGSTGTTTPVATTTTTLPTTTTTLPQTATKLAIISLAQVFATTTDNASTTSGSIVVQAQDSGGAPVVLSSPLTVIIGYSSVTGVTLSSQPTSVTIPSGSSVASFTVAVSTSASGGSFAVTASATGLSSSGSQTESVEADANSSSSNVGTISGQSVTAGSGATYSVPINNTSGFSTRYYEVIGVEGLLSGETAGAIPSACQSIPANGNSSVSVAITTSSSRPSGTYTLDFLVERFNSGGCTGGVSNYYQGDGSLTVH